MLQGSANLEFWETYTAKDVTPYLQAADNKLRAIVASETPAEEADNAATLGCLYTHLTLPTT